MTKPTNELLEHNYDGILEYNNPLPAWWVYLFIITIIFAVVYLWYYHITNIGFSSAQEYAIEMTEAEKFYGAAQTGFEAKDFVLITNQAGISSGKAIFEKNCFTCHGKFGEGGVGSNLTDDYWIHGPKLENIATTIFNGVPDKAMPTWKTLLSKQEILQVAGYVISLHGTNPPNAKAPQGTLYKPE